MHKRKVILFKTIWRRSCPAFLQESSSRAWNANFATWHQQHFKQYIVDLMKFNTFKWIYLVLQTRGISKTDVFSHSRRNQNKHTYHSKISINEKPYTSFSTLNQLINSDDRTLTPWNQFRTTFDNEIILNTQKRERYVAWKHDNSFESL